VIPAGLLHVEWLVGLAVVGAVVGSFLNVCIWRIPRGESVVRPGSRCPACGTPIRPWHNVPVLSWFWLGGKCAACGTRISPRYPFVEALNAALWVLAGWRFGPGLPALVLLPFLSAMVVLFFTDWDHMILPDRVTLPLAVLGLALAPWNPRLDLGPGLLGSGTVTGRLAAALLGAAVGWGLFFFLVLTWRVLFDREAMGGGDLKMMLGVGAFLGFGGVVTTVFLASVVGTLVAAPYLLTARWHGTRELPFGCFLAPAAVISALWGREMIAWYLHLLPA